MKQITAHEFVRRFKHSAITTECRYTFFLGAGCSVSSGILGAGDLVKSWLPRLKKLKTGNEEDLETWAKEEFKTYNGSNHAELYGEVMEELFIDAQSRQNEIENIIAGKDPAFGYAVFAQLISSDKFGKHCNIILTTNFDDLVADALYIYSNKKPLVIYHDSLVGFVTISRTRPLVLKLHGDARLAPRNTSLETKELDKAVKNALHNVLKETGLVFIGYGGNDKSILNILKELPISALPSGIFWVNDEIPDNELKDWLIARNAVWVKHGDFDELMLLLWDEFEFKHPDKNRFDKLFKVYFDTFNKLKQNIALHPPTEERVILEEAVKKAESQFESEWAVISEAEKIKNKHPEKSQEICLKGLSSFPGNYIILGYYALLLHETIKDYIRAEEYYLKAYEVNPNDTTHLGNYASFLHTIRKEYDKAEEYYLKALKADTNNAIILGNYAIFLKDIRKEYDKAEEYYLKALKADPNDTTHLGNYASFLHTIRKDYDKAEEYYLKALKGDPNHANNLGNYSVFLHNIRKDYDKAEEYYLKALKTDPNHASNLGNYASFLETIRKEYDKAEEYYLKALKTDPNHASNLGNYASFLETIRKEYDKAEEYYLKALKTDPNHASNLGNYASFLETIRKEHDKAEEYYLKALKTDPNDANNLGNYAVFLHNIRKDYDKAEEYYLKALKTDPNHASNLGNYASFLETIRKEYDKAEEYYLKALKTDPNHASNLGNYGIFLQTIRKNYDKAIEYYLDVLKIDPTHSNSVINNAGLLLAGGKKVEGFEFIGRFLQLESNEIAKLECYFYQYAHSDLQEEREKALQLIKDLIKAGVRSEDWNMQINVDRAIQDGHPHPEFLQLLSKVISDEAKVSELDKFPEWKNN